MFKKILKFMFLLSQLNDDKQLHYIRATVGGEKGCVEATISDSMAERFKATRGSCSDISCLSYRGRGKLPFCCEITGYSCNEYI